MAMIMALAVAGPKNDEAFFATGAALFVILIFNIALLGILFMTMVVAPTLTRRYSTTLRERNARSFFTGIPVFLGLGTLSVMGFAVHPALGTVALMGSVITLLVGLAAASEDVGRRCPHTDTAWAAALSAWATSSGGTIRRGSMMPRTLCGEGSRWRSNW